MSWEAGPVLLNGLGMALVHSNVAPHVCLQPSLSCSYRGRCARGGMAPRGSVAES